MYNRLAPYKCSISECIKFLGELIMKSITNRILAVFLAGMVMLVQVLPVKAVCISDASMSSSDVVDVLKSVNEIDLPTGAYLEFSKDEYDENKMDGSLLVMDANGDIIGAVDIPWAKDANGNAVETTKA